MSKYITENGKEVTPESPDRVIWYGQCGYWTDDWDLLIKVGPGISACPKCKTPGFTTNGDQWYKGIEKYDKEEPGYKTFCSENKEKCYRHYPKGFMSAWEITKELKEEQDETP